jgi:hypothetical protein
VFSAYSNFAIITLQRLWIKSGLQKKRLQTLEVSFDHLKSTTCLDEIWEPVEMRNNRFSRCRKRFAEKVGSQTM